MCGAEVPSGQKMPISISEVLAVTETVVPVIATVWGLSCDSVKSHLWGAAQIPCAGPELAVSCRTRVLGQVSRAAHTLQGE